MERKRNTTVSGEPFNIKIIELVWDKARKDAGFNFFRKDSCGTTLKRTAYGETTEYGWEIDHITPVTKGGTDDLTNLQPLHWKNNEKKEDNYPEWICHINL